MVARQSGLNAFADQIGQLPLRRSFSVPWANWQSAATHRVISGHDGGVSSVAVGELEGRAVIVSGGEDGTVRVWDLATGRPVGEPLRGHDGAVRSVAVGELEGRAVIVSGGEDGTVRVWDLAIGPARRRTAAGPRRVACSVGGGGRAGGPRGDRLRGRGRDGAGVGPGHGPARGRTAAGPRRVLLGRWRWASGRAAR